MSDVVRLKADINCKEKYRFKLEIQQKDAELKKLREASRKVVKQFWTDRYWLMDKIEELEKVLEEDGEDSQEV